ncbi:hypothetical protein H8958_014773, partial [Nasalis larvatus]
MVYLGPYPTSQQSLRMRLLPHNSIHRPSSIVTTASLGPAPASEQPLLAQLLPSFYSCLTEFVLGQVPACLPAGSKGPASAPDRLSRPKSSSSRPLHAGLLPHTGLFRPSSCILAASPGSAPASWQPLQAQLLPRGSCQLP